jgi:hypothetical protein
MKKWMVWIAVGACLIGGALAIYSEEWTTLAWVGATFSYVVAASIDVYSDKK